MQDTIHGETKRIASDRFGEHRRAVEKAIRKQPLDQPTDTHRRFRPLRYRRTLIKGEVHSRMAIYFLYANKKFIQKYVIHQNFSFQRALNPYEIFL